MDAKDSKTLPYVTIAVTTFDDEAAVAECLRAALEQDYPSERVEILVADAMSMDATREIVLRTADGEPRVRLLDNPERTRAAAMNEIVRRCRGEIIVPMEPGADYGSTHVSKCVEALSTSAAEHLAVIARTAGRTFVERALSAAQKSKLAFAVGSALSHGVVDEPAMLGAVRRRVFEKVGLFDAGARVEEDVELSDRIMRAGGELAVRRDIVVHKSEVASFRDLFRKHYTLGRARARRTVKERRVSSLGTLTPLAMVAGFGALALTASVQPVTPIALTVYGLMTGAAAVRVGRSEGIVTIPIAWAAYPIMHVAHGVGFGSGLVRSVVRPDWKGHNPHGPGSERVAIDVAQPV